MKQLLNETDTTMKEYEIHDRRARKDIRAQTHNGHFDNRLKRCPFCGGRAFLCVTNFMNCIQAVCSDCGCQTEPRPTVEKTINLWNARKCRGKKNAESEELQKTEYSG